MGTILPRRFEPIRVLRKDKTCATFVATDQYLGRNEVVVKVNAKGTFTTDTETLVELFSWHRGLRHSSFTEVLDAGFTPRHDLFYVRTYQPESEFFSSANKESVKELVAAVDFLRSINRVHGAIKPSNVFGTNGSVRISDPWFAQNARQRQPTEEDIRFSAPEVLSGESPGVDSDLYSLGALLYRFFSGRDPFEDSDSESLKAKYIWAAPRPLASVSHVSRTIAEIVTHLLDKDPTRRVTAFESLKNELDVEATSAFRAPAIGLSPKVESVLGVLTKGRGLRIVVVEGPIGCGKGRFVEETRMRALFRERAMVVCEAVGPDPSLDLVRKLLALVDENKIAAGVNCLARLNTFVDVAQEPASQAIQEDINRDLISLLASVCRQVRLLLVVEDVDRTARRMASLLELMAQQGGEIDLSVVATTRPGGLTLRVANCLRKSLGENFSEISLELLTCAERNALSAFLSMDGDVRARAEQRSGGNPAFLEEFCRHLLKVVPPQSVRDVLSVMIAKLPIQTRRVAEVLSLFVEPTTWSVLSKVSGIPEADLRGCVSQLERVGLIDSEGLAIRYPDARSLLQSKIPKPKRTELHTRCFTYLSEERCRESILADHAFHGSLFTLAAGLYRKLANERFTAKDYVSAGRFYSLVSDCHAKDGSVTPLDAADSIKLAKCGAFQGDKATAQAILNQLLRSRDAREDSELLSSIYATLASPLMEDVVQERIRLLRLAIDSLKPDSSQLVHRFRALTIAHLGAGDLMEAEETLRKIECCRGSQEDLQLEDIRASVLMNLGNFKEAADCLQSQQFLWASAGSVSNNLAVCIEQLGDLARAREIQRAALREARASGSLYPLIFSLANLGAMETKLGNFESAEAFFGDQVSTLRALQRRHGEGGIAKFTSSYADVAMLLIQRGDYRSAAGYLNQIDLACAGPFPLERFLVDMTRCELYLEINQAQKALKVLEGTRQLPLNGEFFEVERLLIHERLITPSSQSCRLLEQALDVCERLGTIYQCCRVRIALAKHLIALGSIDKATHVAQSARAIASGRGYRPLAARALLFVGLSSDGDEKEVALRGSLDEAAGMGLAPLLAECSFHIGVWRLSRGDYSEAQNYLSRSMSVTSRLADELSATERRAYLSNVHRQQARTFFNDAVTKAASSPSRMIDKDANLFGNVYRLVAAMTASSDLIAAMGTLLDALKECVSHPIVVVSGRAERMILYPIRATVSDEIRRRIITIESLSGGRPYISGFGVGRSQRIVIWMPILSLALPSGIFIESDPGGSPPNERELEFLTVVAAVSGASFDHVCTKRPLPPPSSEVQPFGIVGNSTPIREVRTRIEIAATNAAAVLIEGESGTGKELVAKAIHLQSSRGKEPFVAVDCGALPEGLIESELFGATKGAYTGAVTDRQGLFESANRGTIFLDEISNLSIAAQAKLLRVLQEREVRRIGSMSGKAIDVRLIAATNCNLERLVRDGKFRQDLLYRLKVLHILLPPLRARKEDIPALAISFLERLNMSNQLKKCFGPQVMERFAQHNYPGNVRELQNTVERAFYSTSGTVLNDVDFFVESTSIDTPVPTETESWFRALTEGREDFWSAVHDRYKRRDISRERVVALVDFGLRKTRGSYKMMAAMWQIRQDEYHRFMDFLRRSQCLLDFRPYRKFSELGGD